MVVVHAFNLSTWEGEFQAGLLYRASRTARAIQRKPVSRKKEKRKERRKKKKKENAIEFFFFFEIGFHYAVVDDIKLAM